MADRLDGRVALVTGAGSGLGRAMARRFADEGAAVMCADLNEEGAQDTAAQIAEAGGRSAAMRLNVTDSDAVKDALERTDQELGGLQIVVNNAGVASPRVGPDGRCEPERGVLRAACTARRCLPTAAAARS